MTEEKQEPAIPYLIQRFKSRKIRKKQEEIESLKLEIEKAKLEKQLIDIKSGKEEIKIEEPLSRFKRIKELR